MSTRDVETYWAWYTFTLVAASTCCGRRIKVVHIDTVDVVNLAIVVVGLRLTYAVVNSGLSTQVNERRFWQSK